MQRPVFVLGTIMLFGLVFNSLLIAILIRHRRSFLLVSPFYTLMLWLAISDSLIEVGALTTVYFFTLEHYIPLSTCCHALTPNLLGYNSSTAALLAISVDRLVSVVAPLWHRKVKKPLYLACIMAVGIGYAVGCLIYAFTVFVPQWQYA